MYSNLIFDSLLSQLSLAKWTKKPKDQKYNHSCELFLIIPQKGWLGSSALAEKISTLHNCVARLFGNLSYVHSFTVALGISLSTF